MFPIETRTLQRYVSGHLRPNGQKKELFWEPRISIVIPSFNQVKYIERTLFSVFNQNYSNIELIVIDGRSTDGTVDVLEKYSDRISYLYSGPDEGQSDALNHGFSKAGGDIFAWLNSDDVYLPGALAAAVEAFQKSPEASVVFGDWWSIDGEDRVTEINYAFDFNIRHFVYEGFHLNSQAMFWRRDVHGRFGEFDVRLHRTMDYDLILRLGRNEGQKRFLRVGQALAGFRRHPNQKTTNFGGEVVASEHRLIARKNGYTRKYSVIGCLLRLAYRLRRAWWYAKRGGVIYAFAQISKRLRRA